MTEHTVPNDADNDPSKESPGWISKDYFANDDDEIRILSKEPVTQKRFWMIVRLVVGLTILVLGAAPAVTGSLPDMTRALMVVGGLTLALFSYPRFLRFLIGLVGDQPMSSHGNAIQVRRRSRSRRRGRNFNKLNKVYRMFK